MEDHPFDRFVAALRTQGQQIRSTARPDQVRACCPAHDDRNPSLLVTRLDHKVRFKCFAGCDWKEVLAALGLQPRDMFSGPKPLAVEARRVVAVYTYCDESGRPVAEKVRVEPKAFYFRRPGEREGGRLDGIRLGLYRREQVKDEEDVYVVEGEKAANRLAETGIPTVCPPHGASSWTDVLTSQVVNPPRRQIVILADADKAGRKHALKVARSCYGYAAPGTVKPVIKLVELEGLQYGGDVVDWLDSGHSAEELRAVAEATPSWTPTLAAELRRIRKREQGKIRSKNYRDRHRNDRSPAGHSRGR